MLCGKGLFEKVNIGTSSSIRILDRMAKGVNNLMPSFVLKKANQSAILPPPQPGPARANNQLSLLFPPKLGAGRRGECGLCIAPTGSSRHADRREGKKGHRHQGEAGENSEK